MRNVMRAALVIAPLLGASAASAEVDVTVLASSCSTCHGPGLAGSGAMPSLKGKRATDIATALKAFQSGEKPATIMTRLSKGWTAEQIDALAAKLGEGK